jgi:hypothetical protein
MKFLRLIFLLVLLPTVGRCDYYATQQWVTNYVNSKTDPDVAAFVSASHIVNLYDQLRLANAVNFLKSKGRWPYVNDFQINNAYSLPTNNLTFFKQPIYRVNPIYNGDAFDCNWTNNYWYPLRQSITNPAAHTEVIVGQANDAFATEICRGTSDPNSGTVPYSICMGGVMDTNTTGSGVWLSRWGGGWGLHEHTGASNNWVFNKGAPNYGGVAEATNGFADYDWNAYTYRTPLTFKISIHSTDANHIHSLWNNAVPCAAYPLGVYTNRYNAASYPNTVCTNTLQAFVVGTNQDYLGVYPAVPTTNTFAGKIFGTMSLTTNVDQAFASDITTFFLMLQPQDTVNINTGTSMMNPAETRSDSNNNINRPFTNSLAWIRLQNIPNDIVVDYASPGSRLGLLISSYRITYAPQTGWTNAGYFPAFFFQCVAQSGKNIVIRSDDGRNDTTSTPNSWSTAYGYWFQFYTNLFGVIKDAGGKYQYRHIATPQLATGTGGAAAQNTNLWLLANAMKTNSYVYKGAGGFSFPIGVLSTNDVANLSAGGATGAHLDGTNGYKFLVQEMWAMEGGGAGYIFCNPTNPAELWTPSSRERYVGFSTSLFDNLDSSQIANVTWSTVGQLNTIGLNGTNYANQVGQASTNYANQVGQANTNLSNQIGQNATNYINLKITNWNSSGMLAFYGTNGVPNALILTNGSLCVTTNGQIYVRSNNVWQVH